MLDVALFRSLEESLLDPVTRQSPERLSALIADDFCEFGSSGSAYSKADVLAAKSLPDIETPLANLSASELGPGVVLVTYVSATRVRGGIIDHALRSSIWVYRDGRWQMRFHQGTRTGNHTLAESPPTSG